MWRSKKKTLKLVIFFMIESNNSKNYYHWSSSNKSSHYKVIKDFWKLEFFSALRYDVIFIKNNIFSPKHLVFVRSEY